jgi:hypothetical protein
VTLGVVDFLQVGVVADRLDPLLQGNDLVVAGHHGDGAEFQPLCQVHGADRDMAAGGFDILVENLERHARLLRGGLRAVQLTSGSDEHADLVRHHAGLCMFRNPIADGFDLLTLSLERLDCRRRTVED